MLSFIMKDTTGVFRQANIALKRRVKEGSIFILIRVAHVVTK